VSDFVGKVELGKVITLFSDTHGEQNRTINMCRLFLHAVRTLNISTINECFLSRGTPKWRYTQRVLTLRNTVDMFVFDPILWYV
jgi:hypothetical protein